MKECIYPGICHDLKTIDRIRICEAEDDTCEYLTEATCPICGSPFGTECIDCDFEWKGDIDEEQTA